MRIKAAVLEQFGAPLQVTELELAEPKAGEVLVRLAACGICRTDLFSASGADPEQYLPTVLGHEGAGVVERVGEGVTLVRPGDHVLTLFSAQCDACPGCASPKTNRCTGIRELQNRGYLPDGTTRLSRAGEPVRHYMGCSAYAEYTVVPQIALARIDPAAPLDLACLFACGLTTGLGAAMSVARVEPGSSCVVFGAGLVGMGAVAGCRLRGAERIICVDLSAERLELARGQGATDVVIADEHTVDRIRELTGGYGADYSFEATGNVTAMRHAVESCHVSWGVCTVTGVVSDEHPLRIPPSLLLTGRRVGGALFGGVKGRTEVPRLVDRWLAGELDLDPYVSHRIPLDEINKGFELLSSRSGARTVIEF